MVEENIDRVKLLAKQVKKATAKVHSIVDGIIAQEDKQLQNQAKEEEKKAAAPKVAGKLGGKRRTSRQSGGPSDEDSIKGLVSVATQALLEERSPPSCHHKDEKHDHDLPLPLIV